MQRAHEVSETKAAESTRQLDDLASNMSRLDEYGLPHLSHLLSIGIIIGSASVWLDTCFITIWRALNGVPHHCQEDACRLMQTVDQDCSSAARMMKSTEARIGIRQSVADVLERANLALAMADADQGVVEVLESNLSVEVARQTPLAALAKALGINVV
jgi:hypothetical protein